MKLPLNMKELRDAQCHYISLVDRSASRIPFRVVKKETAMLDLSSIGKLFKTSKAEKPFVSAVIVYAQKGEALNQQVRQAIKQQGFLVDQMTANPDGETILFSQDESPLEGATLVRMSDQMLLAVKGFSPQNMDMDEADFGAAAASNSFHQGVDSSLDILFSKICSALNVATDEEDASAKVGALIDGFKKYVIGMVGNLPTAAFKADLAVREVVDTALKSEQAYRPSTALTPKPQSEEKLEQGMQINKADIHSLDDIAALIMKPDNYSDEQWDTMDKSDKIQWMLDSTNTRTGSPMAGTGLSVNKADMKKPAFMSQEDWDKMSDDQKMKMAEKTDMKKPDGTKQEDWDAMSMNDKKMHMEKMKAAKQEPEKQNETNAILDAIKGVTAKVDGFVETLTALEATVGTLAKKSDTLEGKLNGTVVGQAKPGDAPRATGRETAQKTDPRSGAFDTGFIRRRS